MYLEIHILVKDNMSIEKGYSISRKVEEMHRVDTGKGTEKRKAGNKMDIGE